MKALILVGGYGTRLRPLTFTVPKPLVEFANLPIVSHQIEALVRVGVKKIVLAVNVQPALMIDYLREEEKKHGISIVCSQEDVPMGTAGPLALARSILDADDAPFFMFNSDVICEFPLQQMLDFHRAHGTEGTIMVTEVTDPSKYGVVVSEANGQIKQFVEKPQVFVSNKINAGIYLFNTAILKRIEMRPTSIEREIFPKMASEQQLFSMVLPGYWMDIGQPKDYLSGMVLHLSYLQRTASSQLASGEGIVGNVLIHPTAKVAKGAVLGPDVVIGPNVVVEEGARVKRTTVLAGSTVKAHSFISSSIIGWKSSIGSWTRVTDSVLGEDVSVSNEISIHEATVCPHKGVGESIHSAKLIM